MHSSTPSPDIDKVIAGTWYTCLDTLYKKIAMADLKVGDLERLVQALPDAALIAVIQNSSGYNAIPSSLRTDSNLLRVVKAARWPEAV